jgi:ankyrin repeat protein
MNLFNKEGNTALCQATQSGNESCVKLLVEASADLNFKGEFGYTALDVAVSKKLKGCGEYLRAASAECNRLKYPGIWN